MSNLTAKITSLLQQNANLNVTAGAGGGGSGSGNGGGVLSAGGVGGSALKLKVIGDIGRFEGAEVFGFLGNTLGGLTVGVGGVGAGGIFADNGSVNDVNARRISANVAANVDSPALTGDLSVRNAVFAISKVVAQKIGADINGNGQFNFTDAGVLNGFFNLSEVDTAIDGLIVVRAAGLNATSYNVAPLLLVTV